MKRTLQELTIKDPFMFAAVMSDETQCRKLLEIVLHKKILQVQVVTEKVFAYHSEYHGVRLDVLAEEAGTKHRFNVEMQVKDKYNLPQRSRYYHSHLDMDMLLKGMNYRNLPNTYVIFICDYDPMDERLYQYTLLNTCQETGQMVEDGAVTIWLSTAGENDSEVAPELRTFLQYVHNPDAPLGQEDGSAYVNGIRQKVAAIKRNRDWEAKFMLLREMLADEKAEGKIEGKTDTLLMMLSCLGEVPDEIVHRILEEKNVNVLNRWLLATREVSSVQEFVEKVLGM